MAKKQYYQPSSVSVKLRKLERFAHIMVTWADFSFFEKLRFRHPLSSDVVGTIVATEGEFHSIQTDSDFRQPHLLILTSPSKGHSRGTIVSIPLSLVRKIEIVENEEDKHFVRMRFVNGN